jgi:hypothetical protein
MKNDIIQTLLVEHLDYQEKNPYEKISIARAAKRVAAKLRSNVTFIDEQDCIYLSDNTKDTLPYAVYLTLCSLLLKKQYALGNNPESFDSETLEEHFKTAVLQAIVDQEIEAENSLDLQEFEFIRNNKYELALKDHVKRWHHKRGLNIGYTGDTSVQAHFNLDTFQITLNPAARRLALTHEIGHVRENEGTDTFDFIPWMRRRLEEEFPALSCQLERKFAAYNIDESIFPSLGIPSMPAEDSLFFLRAKRYQTDVINPPFDPKNGWLASRQEFYEKYIAPFVDNPNHPESQSPREFPQCAPLLPPTLARPLAALFLQYPQSAEAWQKHIGDPDTIFLAAAQKSFPVYEDDLKLTPEARQNIINTSKAEIMASVWMQQHDSQHRCLE